ncbi:MAG: hypothetical protein U0105_23700 [Candidatus Obscuribacterales bacterium]
MKLGDRMNGDAFAATDTTFGARQLKQISHVENLVPPAKRAK